MNLPIVDVLIPTSGPPASLGATLASLANQRYPSFRVMAAGPARHADEPELADLVGVLEARGHAARLVDTSGSPTAGGRAQALLDHAAAPYVLVVDDGVFLEADLIGRLVAGIRSSGGGFVGANVVDLRFRDEHRPEEEQIEFWDGPVRPEEIGLESRAWARRRVHRGANLQHLRERLPRTRDRLYHVADILGCVLYDAAKLRSVGGFHGVRDPGHLTSIPPGTASATQLRLLARYGGSGLFPSGAYRLTPMSSDRLPWPAAPLAVAEGPPRRPEAGPAGAPPSFERPHSAASQASGLPHLVHRVGSRTDFPDQAGVPGVRRYRRDPTPG